MLVQSSLDFSADEVVECLCSIAGVDASVRQEFWNRVKSSPLFFFCFLGSPVGECKPTPHTSVSLSWGVLSTSRAVYRTHLFGLFGLNVFPVKSCVLPLVTLLAEMCQISASVIASTFSALPVFDTRLRHPEIDEPSCIRLSKIGRRDRLRHACSFGGVFEIPKSSVVGRWLRVVEFRPQVIVTLAWVLIQPPIEVRNRINQVDRSFSFFTTGVKADRVLRVEDIANLEMLQLSTSKPCLKLDGYQRFISRISSGFDHRKNVFFPTKEVTLAWYRVEVLARRCTNPGECIRCLLDLEPIPAKRSQRRPVVLVRVLVRVFTVNPLTIASAKKIREPRRERYCATVTWPSGACSFSVCIAARASCRVGYTSVLCASEFPLPSTRRHIHPSFW